VVQPLNQTQGYTQVGQAEPLALAKTEVTPDLVKQTESPSILSTEPQEPPKSSQDLSQAAQVAPVDSGNAPAQATATTPTVQTNSFASNLGNILSSILQPTEADKGTETPETSSAAPSTSEQKNTPVVEPQKEEAPVPGLEGYKSVLPSTKVDKPTNGKGNKFLNLVGEAEGTDKGRGYNESLAYGKFSGGAKDLTNMTFDQIDALQGQMLNHPANHFNSSALGRYQIVRRTLRTFRDQLGLKGSDKFSPTNQDRLAMAILKVQGPGAWEGLKKPGYMAKAHAAMQES